MTKLGKKVKHITICTVVISLSTSNSLEATIPALLSDSSTFLHVISRRSPKLFGEPFCNISKRAVSSSMNQKMVTHIQNAEQTSIARQNYNTPRITGLAFPPSRAYSHFAATKDVKWRYKSRIDQYMSSILSGCVFTTGVILLTKNLNDDSIVRDLTIDVVNTKASSKHILNSIEHSINYSSLLTDKKYFISHLRDNILSIDMEECKVEALQRNVNTLLKSLWFCQKSALSTTKRLSEDLYDFKMNLTTTKHRNKVLFYLQTNNLKNADEEMRKLNYSLSFLPSTEENLRALNLQGIVQMKQFEAMREDQPDGMSDSDLARMSEAEKKEKALDVKRKQALNVLKTYEEIVSHDVDDIAHIINAYGNAGYFLFRMLGDIEAGHNMLGKARKFSGSDPHILMQQAVCEYLLALKTRPSDPKKSVTNRDLAEMWIDQATTRAPDHYLFRQVYAQLLLKFGEYDNNDRYFIKANQEIQRVKEILQKNVQETGGLGAIYYYTLASVFVANKKWDEAISNLKHVRSCLSPDQSGTNRPNIDTMITEITRIKEQNIPLEGTEFLGKILSGSGLFDSFYVKLDRLTTLFPESIKTTFQYNELKKSIQERAQLGKDKDRQNKLMAALLLPKQNPTDASLPSQRNR